MKLGRLGEDLAANALREAGYGIVARNMVVARHEVDIVAREGAYLVFVEVKTRSDRSFGAPMEAVTPKVRRRIREAANLYLARHKLKETPVRFDVVTVDFSGGGEPSVEITKNAF